MIDELVIEIQSFLDAERKAEDLKKVKFKKFQRDQQELCELCARRDNLVHKSQIEVVPELAKILKETENVEPFPEAELTPEQEQELDRKIEEIEKEADLDREELKKAILYEIGQLERRESAE